MNQQLLITAARMSKSSKSAYHDAGGILADAIHKPYSITNSFTHRTPYPDETWTSPNDRKMCIKTNTKTENCFLPKLLSCCRCLKRNGQPQIFQDIQNYPNYSCIDDQNFTENTKTMEALMYCGPRKCGRKNCVASFYSENRQKLNRDTPLEAKFRNTSIYIPTSCILPHCKCFKPDPRCRKKIRRLCHHSCFQPCCQQQFYFPPQNQGDFTDFCQPQFCGKECNINSNRCDESTHKPSSESESQHQMLSSDDAYNNNKNSPHIKDTLNICEEDGQSCASSGSSNTEESPLPESKMEIPTIQRPVSALTTIMQNQNSEEKGKPLRHSSDDWKSQIQFTFKDNIDGGENSQRVLSNGNHFKDCNCSMCQKRRCPCYTCSKITDRKDETREKCRQLLCGSKDCNNKHEQQDQDCHCNTSSPTSCKSECQKKEESVARIIRNLNKDNEASMVCTGKPDCPCPICCKRRDYGKIKPHHWFSNGLENPLTKHKRLSFFNPCVDTNNNVQLGSRKHDAKYSGNENDLYDNNNNTVKPNDNKTTEKAQIERNESGSSYGTNDSAESRDSTDDTENTERCNSNDSGCQCSGIPRIKSFGLGVGSCCIQPLICNNNCCYCTCNDENDQNEAMASQDWQCYNHNNQKQNQTMSEIKNCINGNAELPVQPHCEAGRHICDRYPRYFKRQRNKRSNGHVGDCSQNQPGKDAPDHCECPPQAQTNYNTSVYRINYRKPSCRKPGVKHTPQLNLRTCGDTKSGNFLEESNRVNTRPDDEAWCDGKPRFRRGRQYGQTGPVPDTFKIFSAQGECNSAVKRGVTSLPYQKCEPAFKQRICNDRHCRMPYHIEFKKQKWPEDLTACCYTVAPSNMFDRYCSFCNSC